MENFIKFVSSTLTIFASLFVLRLLGPLFGGIAGWVVGLFFEESVFSVLSAFGVDTTQITMWQLGVALSFIGTFFVMTVKQPN